MFEKFNYLALVLLMACLSQGTPALADADRGLRLLMIEQAGCAYCVAFNRDIAPIYSKTDLGQTAPLFHADLRKDMPDGVTLASKPFVTPTFILIGPDGRELSRLTGFPGEDFFWPYVEDMVAKAQDKLGLSTLN